MSESFESSDLVAQWKQACTAFDISIGSSIASLVNALETIAKALAQDDQLRVHIGFVPSLWIDLRKLWRDLTRTQLTFWDGDDSEGEGGEESKNKDLRMMCASLAKFTRNLVAGVPHNQTRAFENEPDIRRLLHYHTSWTAMEDDEGRQLLFSIGLTSLRFAPSHPCRPSPSTGNEPP